MMADTAGFTHSGSRDDYFWFVIEVDHFRFFTGDRGFQSLEKKRVDSFTYQSHCILIKAGLYIFLENVGCFDRQRTVYINFKILIFRQKIIFFDLTDKV